jgi:hypothetical protein
MTTRRRIGDFALPRSGSVSLYMRRMARKPERKPDDPAQSKRFIEAARETGADEPRKGRARIQEGHAAETATVKGKIAIRGGARSSFGQPAFRQFLHEAAHVNEDASCLLHVIGIIVGVLRVIAICNL